MKFRQIISISLIALLATSPAMAQKKNKQGAAPTPLNSHDAFSKSPDIDGIVLPASIECAPPRDPTTEAANLCDGYTDTYLKFATPPKIDDAPECELIYIYDGEKKINTIRIYQHRSAFSLDYVIDADTTGDGVFDKELVKVDDLGGISDEWTTHSFPATQCHKIRFRPLQSLKGAPGPSLCELQTLLTDKKFEKQEKPDERKIMVFPDKLYLINGQERVNEGIFSLALGLNTVLDPGVPELLKSVGIKHVSFWVPRILDEIPESKEKPGTFDETYFTDGRFDRYFAENFLPALEKLQNAGVEEANYRMLGAPPYMRDPSIPPDLKIAGKAIQPHFIPPQNDKEWGRLVGTIAKHMKRLSPLCGEIHIWNEPNSKIRLAVGFPDKTPRYLSLFKTAVPEIKKIMPELHIGGPATTGGGVFTWAKNITPDAIGEGNYLNAFVENFPDLVDTYDVHCYGLRRNEFLTEIDLYAAYSLDKIERVIPLSSSEYSYNLSVYDLPQDQDIISADRFMRNTLYVSELLVNLAAYPNLYGNMSYFYLRHQGNAENGGDILNPQLQPTENFLTFWILRNLRGKHVYSLIDGEKDHNLTLHSVRNGGKVITVLVNNGSRERIARIEYQGANIGDESQPLRVETLKYKNGKVSSTETPAAPSGGAYSVSIPAFSIVAMENPDVPEKVTGTISRTDWYSKNYLIPILEGSVTTASIEVQLPTEGGVIAGEVAYGIGGFPSTSRPRPSYDYAMPITSKFNALPLGREVHKYNAYTIPADAVKRENTVSFSYDAHFDRNDSHLVTTPETCLMALRLSVWTESDEAN